MSESSDKTNPLQANESSLRNVLYHHRTQGKAVEGVHIRSVTDALRSLGVRVEILSMRGADPYASDQTLSPTRQKTLLMKLIANLPEPMFELAEIAYNVSAALRLARYLNENPDTEMIYERYSLYLCAGVWVARRKGIPIVLEINDSACVDRMRPVFFRRLSRAIESWTFRSADGLVFVSTLFRNLMSDAHQQIAPSIISQNAANIEKFSFSAEQRDQVRGELNLGDAVVCGYLGSFNTWHAIDQFVYGIADRLIQRPDLKLLLVGDGHTFDAVDNFVRERGLQNQVLLTGRVSHDHVPRLLSAMDVAIMPNAGEYTSPVKMFEFMACSVPPLAPSLAPIVEVLRDNETGWLFEAGRQDLAIDRLFELTKNASELRRVGQAARDYIAQQRQWTHNARQLIDFHAEIVARNSGRSQY